MYPENKGKNWLYNEHPWVSFSIGYNFIGSTIKEEKVAKENDENIKQEVSKINQETIQKLLLNGGQYLHHADGTEEIVITPRMAAELIRQQPNIVSTSSDTGKITTNTLKAASYIESITSKETKTWWVYIGQVVGGKLESHFDINSLPKPGDTITAKDAVYKRERCPRQLQNGEWELGDIQGVVQESESVKLIELREIADKNYWARVEKVQ